VDVVSKRVRQRQKSSKRVERWSSDESGAEERWLPWLLQETGKEAGFAGLGWGSGQRANEAGRGEAIGSGCD
jgi:hypothetical protein